MTESQEIVEISKRYYEDYGPGGISYFAPMGTALSGHRDAEVIAFQVRSFDLHYVMDFLLSSPRLLARMTGPEWLRVFALSGPRPSPSPMELEMEKMGEIYFIGKFLRLNAVEVFCREPSITLNDKKNVLHKSILSAPFFELDTTDEEDLDGEHFISRGELRQLSANLHEVYGWPYLSNNPEIIRRQFASIRVEI